MVDFFLPLYNSYWKGACEWYKYNVLFAQPDGNGGWGVMHYDNTLLVTHLTNAEIILRIHISNRTINRG